MELSDLENSATYMHVRNLRKNALFKLAYSEQILRDLLKSYRGYGGENLSPQTVEQLVQEVIDNDKEIAERKDAKLPKPRPTNIPKLTCSVCGVKNKEALTFSGEIYNRLPEFFVCQDCDFNCMKLNLRKQASGNAEKILNTKKLDDLNNKLAALKLQLNLEKSVAQENYRKASENPDDSKLKIASENSQDKVLSLQNKTKTMYEEINKLNNQMAPRSSNQLGSRGSSADRRGSSADRRGSSSERRGRQESGGPSRPKPVYTGQQSILMPTDRKPQSRPR